MLNGFATLVHPGTPSDEIDIEGTREARAAARADLHRADVASRTLLGHDHESCPTCSGR